MGTPIPIIYVIIETTVGSQFEKHISFPQKEGTARRNIAIVSLFSADTTEAGYKRGRMNSSIAGPMHTPSRVRSRVRISSIHQ